MPPENRLYKEYPDLNVIDTRLDKIERDVQKEIEDAFGLKKVQVDFMEGMEWVFDENGQKVLRKKGGDPNDPRPYFDEMGNRLPGGDGFDHADKKFTDE